MNAVLARRSIRAYTERDVTDDEVEDLLRAAMSAPSAGNEQPWHFVVIRNKDAMNAITQFHAYASMLLQVPVAILVCGDTSLEKHKGFWVQDCSAAIENILIQATDKGLGTVWLGLYPVEERVSRMRELLGIPAHVIPLGLIPIGHPAETKPPSDRFRSDRIHHEKW